MPKQKQPVLPGESMWDLENDSEQELGIRYKEEEATKENRPPVPSPEKSYSKNAPLLSYKRVPDRFTPSKLRITFGDKTSTVIRIRKNVARKRYHVKEIPRHEDH